MHLRHKQKKTEIKTISVGQRSSHQWHCKLLPSADHRRMSRSAAAVPLGTSRLVSCAEPLQDPCIRYWQIDQNRPDRDGQQLK